MFVPRLSALMLFLATSLAAQVPQPPRSVRLYVFDCGTLYVADMTRFRLTPQEVATTNMAVACYLIVHPKGTLIWDTGAVPDAAWTPTGDTITRHLMLPDSVKRDVVMVKSLSAQLAQLGYSPSAITYLALSHCHYDHTANANAFAGATWLVRQNERVAMFAPKPLPLTQPATYSALRASKTVIIDSDAYDVFGDGTVVIKTAPRTYAGAPDSVSQDGQNRRRCALRRPVSLSGTARAESCADVRVRSGRDAREPRGGRGVPA